MPLLVSVGLVKDETAFNKKGIRINTANLYKQQKFNLLREENEGYSGLISELLGGMGPPVTALYDIPFDEIHNWQTAPTRIVEQESPRDRNRRARNVMRNISALIGYFDLDPNRVLDIILDVFSSNVVLHWPFFMALLWASPWARSVKREATSLPGHGSMDFDTTETSASFAGIEIKVADARGNKTCAQLLGFKFDYYQAQETREDVPHELYLMSAMLIAQGLVKFTDLWSHLSPDESGMKKVQSSFGTALKDKAANARGNALSMAAALTDDDAPVTTKSEDQDAAADVPKPVPPKEPPNQILGLLKALLALGEMEYSLFILGVYPWLVGAFEEVATLLIRLLKVSLRPVYSTISSAAKHEVFKDEFVNAPRHKFDIRRQALLPANAPRLQPTALLPEPAGTSIVRFVCAFGPRWTDKIPLCKTGADVVQVFLPLLRVLGVSLHRDIELFQQLCRLGRVQLKMSDTSQDIKAAWLEIIRFHLFPALTLTSGNSGLLNELWGLLRTLPYTERFGLYGEWKNELYKLPEIRYRQLETEKEAKGILKRISKDNLKVSGRALAKASHANPLIFFNIALNQVQVYDNMIPHIVECAKYLTLLEYDVFSFNLIDALSNPAKERTKQDGTNISLWLKSLASFTGTLYRRYTMMDPIPVLQYICNQLKANNSKDLVIISELILKMSGIEPLANLADKQIAALSGGRILRMEAMMTASAGPGTTSRLAIRRTGARLMEALKESRLAIALLILIAQQRQVCVHLIPESEAHLRYLGNLADTCQEVLFQYVEFLHSQLEPATYAELVPSLRSLCLRFSIEPAIAFHIARPGLLYAMKQADDVEAESKLRADLIASKSRNRQELERAAAAKTQLNTANPQETLQDAGQTAKEDAIMAEHPHAASDEMTADTNTSLTSSEPAIWKSGLQEAIQTSNDMLEDEVVRILGPNFYTTFWQLSLADIQVPAERYEQEMRVLSRLLKESDSGSEKKSAAYLRHQESLDQIRAELKARTLAHQATRKRLNLEKDHWFAYNDGKTRPPLVNQILQHCLIPRALLSPTDAIFAAKFIKQMHLLGAKNFSSLTLYDRVFIEHVAPIVFSSTENEANSYARFLQVVLDDLTPWYRSEELFNKEAVGNKLPGFQLRWGERRGGEDIPKEALCTYEQFKGVLLKWHDHLRKAFKACLSSQDFMRIRNAIAVMNRLAQNFPLFDTHGRDLIEVVDKLVKEESRGSLKVLGQGLLATLRKHQPEWLGKIKPAVATKQDKPVAVPSATSDSNEANKPEQTATQNTTRALNSTDSPSTGSAIESASQTEAQQKTNDGEKPLASGPRIERIAHANINGGSASPSAAALTASPHPPTGQQPANDRAGAQPKDGDVRDSRRSETPRGVNYDRVPRSDSSAARTSAQSTLPPRPGRGPSYNGHTRDESTNRNDRARAPSGSTDNKGPDLASHNSDGPTSLAAARQAALGTMMNPPQSPASTAGAQAVRHRATPAEREPESERDAGSKVQNRDRLRGGRQGSNSSAPPSRNASPPRVGRSNVPPSGPAHLSSSRGSSPRGSGRGDHEIGSNGTAVSSRDATPSDRNDRSEKGDERLSGWRERREREQERETRERAKERDERRRHAYDRPERNARDDGRRSASDRFDSRDRDRKGDSASSRGREGERDRDRDRARERDSRRSKEELAPRGEENRANDAPSTQAPIAERATTREEDAVAAAYGKRRRVERDREQDADDRGRESVPSTRPTSRSREASHGPGISADGRQESRAPPTGPARPADRSNNSGAPAVRPSNDRVASAPVASNSASPNSGGPGASGLKRSLADRLSGQEVNTTAPVSQHDSIASGSGEAGGPDPKRPRVNRNRNSGPEGRGPPTGPSSSTPAGRVENVASAASFSQQGTATPPSGPLRSISISGSAGRERERRESSNREGQSHGQNNQVGDRGHFGREAARDERDRRRKGRREEDRYKDRSRRRAGEEQ